MTNSYDVLVSGPSSSSIHMHQYTNSLSHNAHMLDQSTAAALQDGLRTHSSLRNISSIPHSGDEAHSQEERVLSSETNESLNELASSTSQILVGSIIQRLVKRVSICFPLLPLTIMLMFWVPLCSCLATLARDCRL